MKTLVIASEGMGIWCKDFFEHVAKMTYDKVIFENSERSEIILRSLFFNHEREFPKALPYITWSGENFSCPERSTYPPILKLDIPFFIVAFFELQKILGISFNLDDLRLVKGNERPFFLAYCASAAYEHREKMFNLLKNHGISHGLGLCQNNIGRKLEGTWHHVWQIYKNYRFVLAMENLKKKGYITEKLLNVLISGAIPIYFGDSEWVKEIFNEKAIIFVEDFATFEECAEYIKKVDSTPELYNQYINEPRFVKQKQWFIGENSVYKEMAIKLTILSFQ